MSGEDGGVGTMQSMVKVFGVVAILVLAYNTPGNKLWDSGYPENRTPVAATTTDVDAQWLAALSEIAVATGVAAEYEVSNWGSTLDVTISSLLPGDARELAQMLCHEAREHDVDSGWTVRVFLPMGGDRPAATCMP